MCYCSWRDDGPYRKRVSVMTSNYPPGTSDSDPRAPWNAPEPPEDSVDAGEIREWFEDQELDAGGWVVFEGAAADGTKDDAWFVEHGDDEHGPFETVEQAVDYVMAHGLTDVTEAWAVDAAERAYDLACERAEGWGR